MNSKQKVASAFEGRKSEIPACIFFNCDYKANVAGINVAEFLYGSSQDRVRAMEAIYKAHKEDWIHVEPGISKSWREKFPLFIEGDSAWVQSRKTGKCYPLKKDLTIVSEEWESEFLPGGSFGYSFAYTTKPKKEIKSALDVHSYIKTRSNTELIKEGFFEPQTVLSEKYGKDVFMCFFAGNLIFNSIYFFGIEAGLVAILENPELFQALLKMNLLQEIETVRAGAELGGDGVGGDGVGGDGVWITEMLASFDIISPRIYKNWIFPTEKELIQEIHRLGMKAILFFPGDIFPILDMIIDTGVDALAVENNDKHGNSIDIGALREKAGDRIAVFSNIDPIYTLMNGSEEDIRKEVRRQIETAGLGGRFVLHSNIVPLTVSQEKVNIMIDEGRKCAVK